jgi:hypothetical protein
MDTAANGRMPQVRAIAQAALGRVEKMGGSDPSRALLAQDIGRFNTRALASTQATAPASPPGAPIGDPGMSYLWRMIEPVCSQDRSPFGSSIER